MEGESHRNPRLEGQGCGPGGGGKKPTPPLKKTQQKKTLMVYRTASTGLRTGGEARRWVKHENPSDGYEVKGTSKGKQGEEKRALP